MAARPLRTGALLLAALLLLPLAPAPAQPAAGATDAAAEALAYAEAHRGAWGLHPAALVEVAATRTSLGGAHVWLQQRLGEALVDDGGLAYHRAHDGSIVVVQPRLAALEPSMPVPKPVLPREAAETAAMGAVGGPALRAPLQVALVLDPSDLALAWRVRIAADAPPRDWEVRVEALGGAILSVRDARRSAEGVGQVFHPNPMASSGNAALRDNPLGITTPELARELRSVVLQGLSTAPGEAGRLIGPYVHVAGVAVAPDGVFAYGREDPRFEEVMAYHYLDQAQRHVQALGFHLSERQVLATMYPGEVNAFYSKFTRSIHFGYHGRDPETPTLAGLADAAEDAEIVVHEYGHAVLDDAVPGLAGLPGDSIHEGFADFFALSFLSRISAHFQPCFGEWMGQYIDSGEPDHPPCLRRLDEARRYPEHFEHGVFASPHQNGLIWAGFLWDLAARHDRGTVERVALEAHSWLSTLPEMPDLGPAFLQANRVLGAPLPEDEVAGFLAERGLLGLVQGPQDDAGSGRDAGNHYNAALPLPPGTYDGIVGGPGDREDWFSFHARAGEVLVVDLATNQAGTPGFAPPTDPPLFGQQVGVVARVVNPTWRVVGPVHGCDSGAEDLRFVLQATQDGAWRFWVPEMADNDLQFPTATPYRFAYHVLPDLRAALPRFEPDVAQGSVFVSEDDSVYVRLDGAQGVAAVVAPSGATLTVRKAAAPGVVIAHVGLDGTVRGVRVLSGGNAALTVEGSLLGEPADGTWLIRKAGQENSGMPVGVQLRVAGKVLDDVATSGDPIEGDGLATAAAMQTPVTLWNWHQSPERFDATPMDAVVPRPPASPMCPRLLTG